MRPMKRRRYLSPFLMLLGMAQCGEVTQSSVPQSRVVAVGDSLFVDNRDEFERSIPGIYVDAIWGRGPDVNAGGQTFPTFRQAIPGLVQRVAPGGFFVIFDDGGEQLITDEFAQWVVDQVPDDVTVAWVSPVNPYREWTPDAQANVQEALATQPRATYIDWASIVTPDMTTDGLHLNQAGQYALNHLVWSATK